MTYSGWEIYSYTHSPGDTGPLDNARDSSGSLKQIHESIVRTLTSGQATLNEFWHGKAAEAGTAGLTPLIESSQIASENLDRANRSMQEQSDAFRYVRDAARQVDKERANDNTPEDWLSIGASDDEKAAAKFDADTKFNVELYEPYYQSTQPRRSTLASDYPAAHDPNVSAGGVTPDQAASGTAGSAHGSGMGGSHSSAYSGGSMPGPSSYSAPPGAASYQAPPPPSHTPPSPPPTVSAPAANDNTSAAFAGPTQGPGGTGGLGASPWQPPSGAGPNAPGSGSGFTPGFGPVGGFGPGGGGGYGSGGGRLGSDGGFGPGGSAASGGRGFGAGAGSGAGALSEGGGAGAARPGGMGTAGAKGQPGMGGMGGGARGGAKGTEDQEHERKILLSEEDPDSIFGGYDGNKPTPPVIGA